MGDVYLARAVGPEQVHKAVVLKRMRPERIGDEAARARFVEEARIAVSLVHPHIVPVFEFGELEGEYFLVMELLGGGELARIAGIDCPPLGWAATALLGSQLCDALTYVHSRHDRRGERLIHGDVTPRNVLLSNEGHALLSDFGLARFAPRGRAGHAPLSRSRSRRAGSRVDARADLYSLALVLCEAATGQPAVRSPARARRRAGEGGAGAEPRRLRPAARRRAQARAGAVAGQSLRRCERDARSVRGDARPRAARAHPGPQRAGGAHLGASQRRGRGGAPGGSRLGARHPRGDATARPDPPRRVAERGIARRRAPRLRPLDHAPKAARAQHAEPA